VATFFPFFTEKPTGEYRVGLCRGISCALAGSSRMEGQLERALRKDPRFNLETMECLGACDFAPAVIVNEVLVGAGTEELASDLASDPESLLGKPPRGSERTTIAPGPNAILTRQLESHWPGIYGALEKALSRKPAEIVEEVKKSNLRGLGGAGFPTGMKWSTVPTKEQIPGPRHFVVNADESEPGCFKDRVLLERAPHQLLEGLLIASYAIGAEQSFIFIRGEYERQFEVLQKAIGEAEAAGLIGENVLGRGFHCRIQIARGAGAYISGLDTALLETMEGKKAWPRQPPPFPTVVGLFGKPTVVNNVETVSMLPHIIARGAEWFAGIGTEKSGGTSLFAVSGHVERPGVYEFPMGTPLRTILEAAGGVKGGRNLKGVIPGGASTPVLTPSEIDVPMDFDGLRSVGSFKGAGGVIVLDETADMALVAHNIERFLAHESCGQCTPCREGSEWTVAILDRILDRHGDPSDLENLDRMGENITGKVICALGDTVGVVTRAFMKKFPEDFRGKVGASR
ncbi:MAG: NADH-quinone oxidoreductase subunit NuoF, partial [Vicinamibacteria bacterium]